MKRALAIAGLYALISGAYILISDRLLQSFVQDSHTLTTLSILKGWGFILITAFLLFWERRKSDLALLKTKQSLEEKVTERTKDLDSFSYSVSHDLKAPLRAVQSYVHLLLEEPQTYSGEKLQTQLQKILKACQKMDELTQSLLDLSKISRQSTQFSFVHLSLVAEEVAQDLTSQAPLRKGKFEIEKNIIVQMDPGLARILLNNLLGNAFKFTSKKEEYLIQMYKSPCGKNVIIKDNGVGFDTKFTDKLFTPFQRLHLASQYPGYGIGLAIVHKILRKHGGRIWAQSEEGKGAEFIFSLPKK